MADKDDNESDYVRELNARHARFLALGGNIDLQTEMKGWTPLKDLITPLHRKIVFDLAASGLSNEIVADVVGISKERLQSLFPTELSTAYALCHASMARSLYSMGLAGNDRAATNWIALHNKGDWKKKIAQSGIDGAPPIQVEVSKARETVNGLLVGMLVDKNLRGSKALTKEAPRVDNQTVKVLKGKKLKQIKHVRSEDE